MNITAPNDVTFGNITETGFKVIVVPPSGNPGVSYFGAQVKGGTVAQSCTIMDVSIDPLQCTIDGLRGGREYTVGVKSCLPGSVGCSTIKEKNVVTKTPGKVAYTRTACLL